MLTTKSAIHMSLYIYILSVGRRIVVYSSTDERQIVMRCGTYVQCARKSVFANTAEEYNI